jgi:hypothetical protein
MNPTTQAVIAIRTRTDWAGSTRSFVVRIDGRRAGKLKPGMTSEFRVEPGGAQGVCLEGLAPVNAVRNPG